MWTVQRLHCHRWLAVSDIGTLTLSVRDLLESVFEPTINGRQELISSIEDGRGRRERRQYFSFVIFVSAKTLLGLQTVVQLSNKIWSTVQRYTYPCSNGSATSYTSRFCSWKAVTAPQTSSNQSISANETANLFRESSSIELSAGIFGFPRKLMMPLFTNSS